MGLEEICSDEDSATGAMTLDDHCASADGDGAGAEVAFPKTSASARFEGDELPATLTFVGT